MGPTLKIGFDKTHLISLLADIPTNPYKISFMDSFIAITENWLNTKFCHIHDILPGYNGIELVDFLSFKDIKDIVGNGHFDSYYIIQRITKELELIINRVVTNNIIKEDLKVDFDVHTGIINISY